VSSELIIRETLRNLFEGMPADKVMPASIMAARTFIEQHPAYSFVTARLLLQQLFEEVTGYSVTVAERELVYKTFLPKYLEKGIAAGRLDARLATDFDLEVLAASIKPGRDELFQFLGLQTLYDRYFIHVNGTRIELPQLFWMRVAMGLALIEKTKAERTLRAKEFYDVLSTFHFTSSTPTLFNAGTPFPQLSSCFLTTVPDDLSGIYMSLHSNALEVLGRPRKRLDARARHRLAHPRHQRPIARRDPLPEGRQRFRDRRQPRRQTQGRRLRVPLHLAHRHRRVPRAA
jgi:ribonucleoside-diphosphate reductase alpha chain